MVAHNGILSNKAIISCYSYPSYKYISNLKMLLIKRLKINYYLRFIASEWLNQESYISNMHSVYNIMQ